MNYDFLYDFSKRVEWVGVVESIISKVNNQNRYNEVFSNNEMTNIVLAILRFILEQSLSTETGCSLKDISSFVDYLFYNYYELNMDEDSVLKFTRYIVVDVLQNNGVEYYFIADDYINREKIPILIRLIQEDKSRGEDDEKKKYYALSEQGYNFLFRTKEVENEMQITIGQLKIKEALKRSEFGKAFEYTNDMLHYVQQQRKNITGLISIIKNNISDIKVEQYKKVINDTMSLLESQFEKFNSIYKMSINKENLIANSGFAAKEEDLINIDKTKRLLEKILEGHNSLLLEKFNLSGVYIDAIEDSIYFGINKRFDLQKVIVDEIEKHPYKVSEFHKIFRPLFMLEAPSFPSVITPYQEQRIVNIIENDNQENKIVEDEYDPQKEEEEQNKLIQEQYCSLVKALIDFTIEKNNNTTLEEFLNHLKSINKYDEFITNKSLFTAILDLYGESPIKVAEILNDDNRRFVMQISAEFDIDYVIGKIMSDEKKYITINELCLESSSGILDIITETTVKDNYLEEKHAKITNFIIKVV